MSWSILSAFLVACSLSVVLSETDQPEVPSQSQSSTSYIAPQLDRGSFHFLEYFPDEYVLSGSSRWVKSQSKKGSESEKYEGIWNVESTNVTGMDGDLALVLKSPAKHHGIASRLDRDFVFNGKPFVFQYDVKFTSGQECGGAYVKLLQKSSLKDLKDLNDKTPYTIMFGPDKCGREAHLRLIFQHKNPLTGAYSEKHWKEPTSLKVEDWINDKKTHVYTLVVKPDSTFQVSVDGKVVGDGSMLTDLNPPINPEKEIDDPNDKKPADWDERKYIPDPNAKKPDNWDEKAPRQIEDPNAVMPEGWLPEETEMIPDESAVQPDDWDESMDGEWEPPLVENPKCKAVGCGKWKAPLIDNPKCKDGGCGPWSPPQIENPSYKGKWAPRKIPNPEAFEDKDPYKLTPIDTVALELWSISNNVIFDNFLITDDPAVASKLVDQTWKIKSQHEDAAGSVFGGSTSMYLIIAVALTAFVGLVTLVVYRTSARRSKKSSGDSSDEETETIANKGAEDDEADEQPTSSGSRTETRRSEDDVVESKSEGDDDDEDQAESQEDVAQPTAKESTVTRRSKARREQ